MFIWHAKVASPSPDNPRSVTAFPRGRGSYIAPPVSERVDGPRLRLVPWEPRPHARIVREDIAHYAAYESEGSQRRALGSISVAADAHWIATLTVPIPEGHVAFVHLERRGALPAAYRGSEESADFSVPVIELKALVALLAGIVAQAGG
jgi:hypothetical protein